MDLASRTRICGEARSYRRAGGSTGARIVPVRKAQRGRAGSAYLPPCRRSSSNSSTPAATETFRLSTAPAIGIPPGVAVIPREPAQPAALRTQHQRHRGPVELALETAIAAPPVVGADDPDLGAPSTSAACVRGSRAWISGHRLRGAGATLLRGGVRLGGPVARHDDGDRAGRIGRAQARAEIVRILTPSSTSIAAARPRCDEQARRSAP